MTKTVTHLNALLARELGTNVFGEAVFQWAWSEDLFWPEFATGRMIDKPVMVPIIGGGEAVSTTERDCWYCGGSGKLIVNMYESSAHEGSCWRCQGTGKQVVPVTIPVPEYRKEKMAPNLDHQWVMTVWMAAEQLTEWQSRFPGAPYPARGYRIHTNASLPSYEGGSRTPNLEETERFIKLIRFQRSHTLIEATIGIDDERTAKDAAVQKEIEAEIRDDFPAFMNVEPGKRGNYVSFPYSKKDMVQ